MNPLPNKLLLSIPDTAATLSVSRAGIYRLINQGELSTVKIGARCLIPMDSITKLISARAA